MILFAGSVGSKSPGVSSGSDAFQTLVHVAASAETLSTAQEKGTFIIFTLRIYVLFSNTKHNVHRFTLNLNSLKIMIVESFPENITYLGAVVFGVKQCHRNSM